MVTIRLSRGGAKKRPFYHIVVADSRRARDSRFIERLGYFDPIASGQGQRLSFNTERANWWIGKGARPSDRVAALIVEAGREPVAPEAVQPAAKVKAEKPESKPEAPKVEARAEEPKPEVKAEEPKAEASAAEAETEVSDPKIEEARVEIKSEASEAEAAKAEEPRPEADAQT